MSDKREKNKLLNQRKMRVMEGTLRFFRKKIIRLLEDVLNFVVKECVVLLKMGQNN